VAAGELDALVLVLVLDELVFVADLEHPKRNAGNSASAKIGFNVFIMTFLVEKS
jgi:hypothetical protein